MNKLIKYLGVDWGRKRIGLALGDSETKIATPFKIVNDLNGVLEVIIEEQIDEIVIGEPVALDGKEVRNYNFLEFKEEVENIVAKPVHYVDERLTSKMADSLSGDKRTKASRDSLAAMLILEHYLEITKDA